MADKFVLVRMVNMRGVNLNVFEFDYDLTWVGFFLNSEEHVYGRYGGRDSADAEAHLTLAGLKHAMSRALAAHAKNPLLKATAEQGVVRPPEQFAAATRLKKESCIHCHQVWDLRRDSLQAEGRWTKDEVWVYPSPERVGILLDKDRGDRVAQVRAGSPADKAGLKAGDVLSRLNSRPVASFADAQVALHHAPRKGGIPLEARRGNTVLTTELTLAEGWRVQDISWRASMWGLSPTPGVYGKDLTAEERQRLGLSEKQLAFKQGDFVPTPAARAGIKAGDIILGFDDRAWEMTMLQFNAFVRLNYQVGDEKTFNVIRGGKPLKVPTTLAKRDF